MLGEASLEPAIYGLVVVLGLVIVIAILSVIAAKRGKSVWTDSETGKVKILPADKKSRRDLIVLFVLCSFFAVSLLAEILTPTKEIFGHFLFWGAVMLTGLEFVLQLAHWSTKYQEEKKKSYLIMLAMVIIMAGLFAFYFLNHLDAGNQNQKNPQPDFLDFY